MSRPSSVPFAFRRRAPTLAALRRRTPTCAALVVVALSAAAAAPAGSASSPAPAGAAEYVALGDSYSSGTGTGQYVDEACRRSSAAFPARVAASLPGTTLTSVACSGATIPDVERDQLASLTPATTLVTLTIGGNDAGFAKVITRCALPSWLARCSPPVERARRLIRRTLPDQLDRLYDEIRLRAPAATVVVAGYPRLLNGIDCGPATFFSRGDARLLNGTADLLRDVLRSRARAAGFRFADVVPAFDGHAVCDDPEWLNGLSAPLRESFHPNAVGHAEGYTPAILAQLAGGAS
jgi:lysophospholipase L1-like esterase